jgi:multimeric flavodoxin WrbA
MKIVVLNGSPKGQESVTMQFVKYLEMVNETVEFTNFDIALRIRALEKNEDQFEEVIAAMEEADGIIWAFPLYYLLVHSSYKRFIELLFERAVSSRLTGKHCALISTSIHFFDNVAQEYMRNVTEELGMICNNQFPAAMNDLMDEEKRHQLEQFFLLFTKNIETNSQSLQYNFQDGLNSIKSSNQLLGIQKDWISDEGSSYLHSVNTNKKVVVLADDLQDETINPIIENVRSIFSNSIEVFDFTNVGMKGPCLGCIHCGIDNICAYDGKDGYIDFYTNVIMEADILIYAGSIKDYYLSSLWKQFFDRSFFKTHTPTLVNKQIAFLVAGDLSRKPVIRTAIESYCEIQSSDLVGILSNECATKEDYIARLHSLVRQLVERSELGYEPMMSFLGVGGRKVFRDDIWGNLRGVFHKDHKNYKKMGLYDFPQKGGFRLFVSRLMYWILKIPFIKKGFQANLTKGMLWPYEQLFKSLEKKRGKESTLKKAS